MVDATDTDDALDDIVIYKLRDAHKPNQNKFKRPIQTQIHTHTRTHKTLSVQLSNTMNLFMAAACRVRRLFSMHQ